MRERHHPARERAYQQDRKACQSKYALKEGTMYRSAATFCEAEVAVKYEKSALNNAGADNPLLS
jgi:hypothetical protein